MTGKECTSTAKPSLVRVKQLAANLYDVQICENIRDNTLKRKNRASGDIEDVSGYAFTLYTGVVDARSRDAFIAECIHVRHSIDDEIALIHKHDADAEDAEYTAYQALRAAVKETANEYFAKEAV